ncbi:MerR family transcriptional regulator [Nitrospina watsonii]|uniref:HTH merR-type domain-containing protein n=1 Tax=Nitrospina watsonii TaxID=1323948 RepID=A0ABM9HE41_9BACT|nr:MerR family transcriptional regulator [Nitrospina watsonii]CAI2718437.1 HTH merR-type domain-containing protein [Nitrospina watsonii]
MDTYTRSQLAKLVRVNKETLRYYETRNLIDPPLRSRSGYRLYSQEDAKRILFIKNAQKLGFSLDEISEILNLQVNKKQTAATVLNKARVKRQAIDNRIEKLNDLRQAIDGLIAACEKNETHHPRPILAFFEEDRFLSDDI